MSSSAHYSAVTSPVYVEPSPCTTKLTSFTACEKGSRVANPPLETYLVFASSTCPPHAASAVSQFPMTEWPKQSSVSLSAPQKDLATILERVAEVLSVPLWTRGLDTSSQNCFLLPSHPQFCLCLSDQPLHIVPRTVVPHCHLDCHTIIAASRLSRVLTHRSRHPRPSSSLRQLPPLSHLHRPPHLPSRRYPPPS